MIQLQLLRSYRRVLSTIAFFLLFEVSLSLTIPFYGKSGHVNHQNASPSSTIPAYLTSIRNQPHPFESMRKSTKLLSNISNEDKDNISIREVDAIIIGAGIGGLSCAALCAKYGLDTLCLEAHDVPGGCAHSFERFSSASTLVDSSTKKRIPFKFDSGPSLLSGMSKKGTNPLRQVLDAVGTINNIEWKLYDGWIVHDYADGTNFKLTTGDQGKFHCFQLNFAL